MSAPSSSSNVAVDVSPTVAGPVPDLEAKERRLADDEPTLGAIFQRSAYAQLPTRFYGILQVCAPLAYQLWIWGWHRTAGWCVVASAFGLWALAQQRLEGSAGDALIVREARPGRRRAFRIARGVAAVTGSLVAFGLVLEAFTHLMAGVFKCPGCAG